MSGFLSLGAFGALNKLADTLRSTDRKMPVLFVGHGSPMNALEDNEFSRYWNTLGKELPIPQAVLCISAHWLTSGTFITAMEKPQTIHDFGGFPDELFQVAYLAPGDPLIANETARLITEVPIGLDHDWGLDHGTWSILKHMYPEANIPVLQLSIDYAKPAAYHYELGKALARLRDKGVLLLGSGNMVHNLQAVAWNRLNESYGFDWALEMNTTFKEKISTRSHTDLINYQKLGQAASLAIPTPDHYYPLLYTLGMSSTADEISFFNDKPMAGSLTMTSVKFGV